MSAASRSKSVPASQHAGAANRPGARQSGRRGRSKKRATKFKEFKLSSSNRSRREANVRDKQPKRSAAFGSSAPRSRSRRQRPVLQASPSAPRLHPDDAGGDNDDDYTVEEDAMDAEEAKQQRGGSSRRRGRERKPLYPGAAGKKVEFLRKGGGVQKDIPEVDRTKLKRSDSTPRIQHARQRSSSRGRLSARRRVPRTQSEQQGLDPRSTFRRQHSKPSVAFGGSAFPTKARERSPKQRKNRRVANSVPPTRNRPARVTAASSSSSAAKSPSKGKGTGKVLKRVDSISQNKGIPRRKKVSLLIRSLFPHIREHETFRLSDNDLMEALPQWFVYSTQPDDPAVWRELVRRKGGQMGPITDDMNEQWNALLEKKSPFTASPSVQHLIRCSVLEEARWVENITEADTFEAREEYPVPEDVFTCAMDVGKADPEAPWRVKDIIAVLRLLWQFGALHTPESPDRIVLQRLKEILKVPDPEPVAPALPPNFNPQEAAAAEQEHTGAAQDNNEPTDEKDPNTDNEQKEQKAEETEDPDAVPPSEAADPNQGAIVAAASGVELPGANDDTQGAGAEEVSTEPLAVTVDAPAARPRRKSIKRPSAAGLSIAVSSQSPLSVEHAEYDVKLRVLHRDLVDLPPFSRAREEFDEHFVSDLAHALKAPRTCFRIVSISANMTVLVRIVSAVAPAETASSIGNRLRAMMMIRDEALFNGVVLQDLDPSYVKAGPAESLPDELTPPQNVAMTPTTPSVVVRPKRTHLQHKSDEDYHMVVPPVEEQPAEESDADMEDIEESFDIMDDSGSGKVSSAEVRDLLPALHPDITGKALDNFLGLAQADPSGNISRDNYVRAARKSGIFAAPPIQLAEAKAKEDAAQAQPEEPSKDVGAGAPPPLPFDASTPGPMDVKIRITGRQIGDVADDVDRHKFDRDVVAECSKHTHAPVSCFAVRGVAAGSIVADIRVSDSPDEKAGSIATRLRDLVWDNSSDLHTSGGVLATTDPSFFEATKPSEPSSTAVPVAVDSTDDVAADSGLGYITGSVVDDEQSAVRGTVVPDDADATVGTPQKDDVDATVGTPQLDDVDATVGTPQKDDMDSAIPPVIETADSAGSEDVAEAKAKDPTDAVGAIVLPTDQEETEPGVARQLSDPTGRGVISPRNRRHGDDHDALSIASVASESDSSSIAAALTAAWLQEEDDDAPVIPAVSSSEDVVLPADEAADPDAPDAVSEDEEDSAPAAVAVPHEDNNEVPDVDTAHSSGVSVGAALVDSPTSDDDTDLGKQPPHTDDDTAVAKQPPATDEEEEQHGDVAAASVLALGGVAAALVANSPSDDELGPGHAEDNEQVVDARVDVPERTELPGAVSTASPAISPTQPVASADDVRTKPAPPPLPFDTDDSGPIDAKIRITGLDLDDIAGQKERQAFDDAVLADVSDCTKVDKQYFAVRGVEAGSVIVEVRVSDAPDEKAGSIATRLQDLVWDQESALYGGSVLCTADPEFFEAAQGKPEDTTPAQAADEAKDSSTAYVNTDPVADDAAAGAVAVAAGVGVAGAATATAAKKAKRRRRKKKNDKSAKTATDNKAPKPTPPAPVPTHAAAGRVKSKGKTTKFKEFKLSSGRRGRSRGAKTPRKEPQRAKSKGKTTKFKEFNLSSGRQGRVRAAKAPTTPPAVTEQSTDASAAAASEDTADTTDTVPPAGSRATSRGRSRGKGKKPTKFKEFKLSSGRRGRSRGKKSSAVSPAIAAAAVGAAAAATVAAVTDDDAASPRKRSRSRTTKPKAFNLSTSARAKSRGSGGQATRAPAVTGGGNDDDAPRFKFMRKGGGVSKPIPDVDRTKTGRQRGGATRKRSAKRKQKPPRKGPKPVLGVLPTDEGPVDASIRVKGIDLADIEDREARKAFDAGVLADVSKGTKVDVSCFRILGVSAGSVITDIRVYHSRDEKAGSIATRLRDLVWDTNSPLYEDSTVLWNADPDYFKAKPAPTDVEDKAASSAAASPTDDTRTDSKEQEQPGGAEQNATVSAPGIVAGGSALTGDNDPDVAANETAEEDAPKVGPAGVAAAEATGDKVDPDVNADETKDDVPKVDPDVNADETTEDKADPDVAADETTEDDSDAPKADSAGAAADETTEDNAPNVGAAGVAADETPEDRTPKTGSPGSPGPTATDDTPDLDDSGAVPAHADKQAADSVDTAPAVPKEPTLDASEPDEVDFSGAVAAAGVRAAAGGAGANMTGDAEEKSPQAASDYVTPGGPDDYVTPGGPDDYVTPGGPDDYVTPGGPDDSATPGYLTPGATPGITTAGWESPVVSDNDLGYVPDIGDDDEDSLLGDDEVVTVPDPSDGDDDGLSDFEEDEQHESSAPMTTAAGLAVAAVAGAGVAAIAGSQIEDDSDKGQADREEPQSAAAQDAAPSSTSSSPSAQQSLGKPDDDDAKPPGSASPDEAVNRSKPVPPSPTVPDDAVEEDHENREDDRPVAPAAVAAVGVAAAGIGAAAVLQSDEEEEATHVPKPSVAPLIAVTPTDSGPVDAKIRITGLDLGDIAGQKERQAFDDAVLADVSDCTKVDKQYFAVRGVEAGSVITEIRVSDSPDEKAGSIATRLRDLVWNRESPLYGGAVLCATDPAFFQATKGTPEQADDAPSDDPAPTTAGGGTAPAAASDWSDDDVDEIPMSNMPSAITGAPEPGPEPEPEPEPKQEPGAVADWSDDDESMDIPMSVMPSAITGAPSSPQPQRQADSPAAAAVAVHAPPVVDETKGQGGPEEELPGAVGIDTRGPVDVSLRVADVEMSELQDPDDLIEYEDAVVEDLSKATDVPLQYFNIAGLEAGNPNDIITKVRVYDTPDESAGSIALRIRDMVGNRYSKLYLGAMLVGTRPYYFDATKPGDDAGDSEDGDDVAGPPPPPPPPPEDLGGGEPDTGDDSDDFDAVSHSSVLAMGVGAGTPGGSDDDSAVDVAGGALAPPLELMLISSEERGPIDTQIRVRGIDLDDIEDDEDRKEFDDAVLADLSKSLKVDRKCFKVMGLAAGSVIVFLRVWDSKKESAGSIAMRLHDLLWDRTSALYSKKGDTKILHKADPAFFKYQKAHEDPEEDEEKEEEEEEEEEEKETAPTADTNQETDEVEDEDDEEIDDDTVDVMPTASVVAIPSVTRPVDMGSLRFRVLPAHVASVQVEAVDDDDDVSGLPTASTAVAIVQLQAVSGPVAGNTIGSTGVLPVVRLPASVVRVDVEACDDQAPGAYTAFTAVAMPAAGAETPRARHKRSNSRRMTRSKLKDATLRLMIQLMEGCGRFNCTNPQCASNPDAPEVDDKASALQRSVELLKTEKEQFCPPYPSAAEDDAARTIQHAARVHKNRQMLQKAQAARTLQRRYRTQRTRMEYRRMRHASVQLQRVFRGYTARKNFRQTRRATIDLQRMYRGHLARRKLAQEKAARNIQAAFRGHKVRKDVAQQKAAAVEVQRVFRGHKARQTKKRVVAARKVQSLYRGHLVRKEVKQKEQAAINVQRVFRGHKARQTSKRVVAAREVQRVFRGHQARKQLAKEQAAAMKIQQLYRTHSARRKAQQLVDDVPVPRSGSTSPAPSLSLSSIAEVYGDELKAVQGAYADEQGKSVDDEAQQPGLEAPGEEGPLDPSQERLVTMLTEISSEMKQIKMTMTDIAHREAAGANSSTDTSTLTDEPLGNTTPIEPPTFIPSAKRGGYCYCYTKDNRQCRASCAIM